MPDKRKKRQSHSGGQQPEKTGEQAPKEKYSEGFYSEIGREGGASPGKSQGEPGPGTPGQTTQGGYTGEDLSGM